MTENESNPTLVLTSKNTFIWTVLLIGWLFDLLFWDKVPGISIPIYLAILLAGGFFLARQQKLSPAPGLYWLLVPIIFFAIMTIIRLEPFTSFLNTVAALVLMALLSHSFLGGKWWQYTFKDYLTSAFSLGLDAIVRPVAVFTSQPKPETLELPVVSGVLINRGMFLQGVGARDLWWNIILLLVIAIEGFEIAGRVFKKRIA